MFALGNGFIRRVDEGVPMTIAGTRRQLPKFELKTNDTAAAIEAADFFNALADKLPLGTGIDAYLDLDGTPARKDYIVSSNNGTVVAITAAAA